MPRRYQHHSAEDIQAWAEMYTGGMTATQIAGAKGVSARTVKKYLLDAGVRVRSTGGRRKIHIGMTAADIGRQHSLKTKFSLSLSDYERMLAEQDGKCAICLLLIYEHRRKHFDVDHDHVTGAVRALLCARCNVCIGQMNDDPDLLERAAAYLRSHQQQKKAA